MTLIVQSHIKPNQYKLLRNEGPSPLIEPKFTEPYYTKPVKPIEK